MPRMQTLSQTEEYRASPYRVRRRILFGLLAAALLLSVCAFAFPDGAVVRLLRFTHYEWEIPAKYGAFHLCFWGLTAVLSVLGVISHGKINARRLDDIVFAAGCLLFFLELYKQLYCHTVLGNGFYNFGVLPLQLCSYSLYCYLGAPLLREGKRKEALYLFSALVQTVGGCVVMGCPLFYKEATLCVHTMLWHTVMIGVGILILSVRGYGRQYPREILPTLGIFLAVLALAQILNILLYPYTAGSEQPLNLFYLSPYERITYILVADVRETLGWFPAVMTYAIGFIAIGIHGAWLFGRALLLFRKRLCRVREKAPAEYLAKQPIDMTEQEKGEKNP